MLDRQISRNELIEALMQDIIIDTPYGWVFQGVVVDIVALHDTESKYLQDITFAKNYKIVQRRELSYSEKDSLI